MNYEHLNGGRVSRKENFLWVCICNWKVIIYLYIPSNELKIMIKYYTYMLPIDEPFISKIYQGY